MRRRLRITLPWPACWATPSRLWGPGRRRAAVDRALSSYREWVSECSAARNAYRAWCGVSVCGEPSAFDAYLAALDREEGAAVRYARQMRRAQRLVEPELALQLVHDPAEFRA